MLHFAAARAHGRNALYQLLVETDVNVGYRDELYRTARDISIQANIAENTMEIDRYIIQIATKGMFMVPTAKKYLPCMARLINYYIPVYITR